MDEKENLTDSSNRKISIREGLTCSYKSIIRKNEVAHIGWKGLKCLLENGPAYTIDKIVFYIKRGKLHELKHDVDSNVVGINSAVIRGEIYVPQAKLYRKLEGIHIDIIVPIYNGYEMVQTLLQQIPRTKLDYRLFLVDDKSPDERILPLLHQYADEKTTVIENSVNLGYTKSINKALKKTSGHVVLLNTDVQLPDYWLERLITPIIIKENIASATPFTNGGEICSYPEFLKNNDLYRGFSLDEIDEIFGRLKPHYTHIPTGVGFCMALNRKALATIGFYNDSEFPIGYGEENDWCQRAVKTDFVNVMVENLFVYHQHGASFGIGVKKKLTKSGIKKVNMIHRGYSLKVSSFCKADPMKKYRGAAEFLTCAADTVLIFTFSWGGGATYFINKELDKRLSKGQDTFVVRYKEGKGYEIKHYWLDCIYSCYVDSTEELAKVVPSHLKEILVNELVTYPDVFDILSLIGNIAERTEAKVKYYLHDYYSICSNYTLIDDDGKYCGICSADECRGRCKKCESISEWRSKWFQFLKNTDEIIVFSNSSALVLGHAYPGLENVAVIPHEVEYLRKVNRLYNKDQLIIGTIGAINEIKGLDILEKMGENIAEKHLKARIIIIGYTSRPPKNESNIICTGQYNREMLPELVEKHHIDILLIPSICPETFSYTTAEAISLGIPVACFNLGGQAEQVRNYENGLVISEISAETALDEIFIFMNGFAI